MRMSAAGSRGGERSPNSCRCGIERYPLRAGAAQEYARKPCHAAQPALCRALGTAAPRGAALIVSEEGFHRGPAAHAARDRRSEEYTSELQSLMRIQYAVI